VSSPIRFRCLLSLTVAMGLAGLMGYSGPGLPPAEPDMITDLWTAIAASGRVEALSPGGPADAWTPVHRRDTLEPRSRIQTGGRGRATLTRGADLILVDPDSELVLSPGEGDGEPTRVEQGRGSALYEIRTGPDRRFEVSTPYLVAGVKGTVFSVMVRDASVAVNVVEGTVEVRTASGERAELFPGDMGLVEGPGGRLEVHREGSRSAPDRRSDLARRSRKKTTQLTSRAAWEKSGWSAQQLGNTRTDVDARDGSRSKGGNDRLGSDLDADRKDDRGKPDQTDLSGGGATSGGGTQ